MGWSFCTGNRNLDAPDGKHCEKSENLASPTLASAITGPVATCIFHLKMNGAAVASGMGTCGLVGQIGVYTGWVNDIAEGTKAAITGMDWAGLDADLFYSSGSVFLGDCDSDEKMWLDQRK